MLLGAQYIYNFTVGVYSQTAKPTYASNTNYSTIKMSVLIRTNGIPFIKAAGLLLPPVLLPLFQGRRLYF